MSPLGDFFTYLTFQDGVRQLYVQEVGNDNAIRLDSIQDFMCCAAWSPDGSQIAYRRGTRSAGTTVVIPRLGGSRRDIRADVALAWSADASRLLSWWPAARYLTISDMATASLVDSIPLGDGHTWVNGADWSPDGERVTVALQDSLGFGIRTLELDGTVIDELVTDTAALTSPRWARDGRGIYYVRAGDGVWKVDVSADGVVRGEPSLIVSDLSSFVSNAIVPAINISDDGDRLLYNRYVGHSNLWRFGSFDTNGGEPAERQPLTRGTADRRTPRLSPDGSTLAYVDVVEGRANLYLIPSAGGTPRQVTFFEQTVWSPAWSPDGSTIAVGAVEGGESGLWLVDVQGGTLRKVDLASFEGDEIAWAPGREIVFQNRGHVELRAVDPGTWQERVVVAQGQMTWWYDLRPAPDGRTLFARRTGGASGMWRVDVATGAAQQVADVVKAPVGWSADASTVYTMDIDSRTHLEREIYRLPAGGGRPELHLRLPLGQAVNALQVAVSPDGRTVFASVQVSSTDVWIVEPFDPR
jgi:Tol biopolymer transport system component